MFNPIIGYLIPKAVASDYSKLPMENEVSFFRRLSLFS